MTKGLHIFTRDFSIHDNLTLNKLSKSVDEVYTCFLLNDDQIKNNNYFSLNSFNFMLSALIDLNDQLEEVGGNLFILKGDLKTLTKFIKEKEFTHVSITRDYTLYAKERENFLTNFCEKINVKLKITNNYLLTGSVDDLKIYKIFTPYYNIKKNETIKVSNYKIKNFKRLKGGITLEEKYRNKKINRKYALSVLTKNKDGKRSGLSAFIKFGILSCRFVYNKLENEEIKRQLWWREFYYRLYEFTDFSFDQKGIIKKYKEIDWKCEYNKKNKSLVFGTKEVIVKEEFICSLLEKLIDEGVLLNRERMLLSNHIIYKLGVHWKYGENLFARNLTDYDPIQNLGGWLWNFKLSHGRENILNLDRQIEKLRKEL